MARRFQTSREYTRKDGGPHASRFTDFDRLLHVPGSRVGNQGTGVGPTGCADRPERAGRRRSVGTGVRSVLDTGALQRHRSRKRQGGGSRLGEGAVKRRFHLVPGLEHIRIGNGMSVESAIKALERRPFVAYAEPNYSVHLAEAVDAPDDYWFTELWGLDNWGQASSFGAFASGTRDADIKVLQAWATASGNNVVVAILDTGIDYNHADLNPNMWIN